jgi:predicted nuclease with TOPRIM domain
MSKEKTPIQKAIQTIRLEFSEGNLLDGYDMALNDGLQIAIIILESTIKEEREQIEEAFFENESLKNRAVKQQDHISDLTSYLRRGLSENTKLKEENTKLKDELNKAYNGLINFS